MEFDHPDVPSIAPLLLDVFEGLGSRHSISSQYVDTLRERLLREIIARPIRRMADGSACWCRAYAGDELVDVPEPFLHGPVCLSIRAQVPEPTTLEIGETVVVRGTSFRVVEDLAGPRLEHVLPEDVESIVNAIAPAPKGKAAAK